jgi:hypothetical protein
MPVVWRDSVFWTVPVFATSDWYPLSQSQLFNGTSVRYLQQAGVAVVNGHTGRVTTIPAANAGPMAQSWMDRFPELFSDVATFDMSFLVRLPPAADGALAVAHVLAETGLRGEFETRAHLPDTAGDTLYSPVDAAPWLDRRTNTVSVTIPLLDPTEDVRGVLLARGGADFRLRWIRGPADGLRWTRVAAALQSASDSSQTVSRATRPLAGPIRIVPSADGFIAVQTQYVVRPDGVPQVLLAAVARKEGVLTGRTLMDAAGLPDPVVADVPVTPEDFRRRVNALYESMREAMRRGDWPTLGAAYEALGRLLRSAPP